jgi:hypothetical protein
MYIFAKYVHRQKNYKTGKCNKSKNFYGLIIIKVKLILHLIFHF